jgi:hypothetical protein
MALPPFLNSVIEWLRAGYPEGVPDVDYVPLFALLGSQLSESDVKAVAEELEHMSKPESAEAIRKAITMVTDHTGERRRRGQGPLRPAAGGWPLAASRALQPGNGPAPAASQPIEWPQPSPASWAVVGSAFPPPSVPGPTNSSSCATARAAPPRSNCAGVMPRHPS